MARSLMYSYPRSSVMTCYTCQVAVSLLKLRCQQQLACHEESRLELAGHRIKLCSLSTEVCYSFANNGIAPSIGRRCDGCARWRWRRFDRSHASTDRHAEVGEATLGAR